MSSTTTYTVVGMTCEHCERSAREEIEEIPAVTAVDVDRSSGAVTVTASAPIAVERIRAAVTEAGYRLAEHAA